MKTAITISPLLILIGLIHTHYNDNGIEINGSNIKTAEKEVHFHEKRKKESHTLKVTFQQASKTEFEQAALQHSPDFSTEENDAKKVDGVIHLRINDQWQAIESLKDEVMEEFGINLCTYYYLGKSDSLDAYLIGSNSFFDDKEWYLVDAKSAKIVTVVTQPIFSPNHQKFANLNAIPNVSSASKGIHISKLDKEKNITKLKSYSVARNKKWIPFEMTWESNNSLLIKVLPDKKYKLLKSKPLDKDFSFVRMIIENE